MRLSDYIEDQEKQENGSPFYIGDGSFSVRRFGTSETNQQIEEIKRSIYGFAPKDIDTNLVFAHWLAEYGVTGWENILDEEENDLNYSIINARKVFLNPAMFLSLNTSLINHATNYSNYLHDEIERDVENVKKN